MTIGSTAAGYNTYNVPYAYRDTYMDTPTAMYRYNNGYIYQVDPTNQSTRNRCVDPDLGRRIDESSIRWPGRGTQSAPGHFRHQNNNRSKLDDEANARACDRGRTARHHCLQQVGWRQCGPGCADPRGAKLAGDKTISAGFRLKQVHGRGQDCRPRPDACRPRPYTRPSPR